MKKRRNRLQPHPTPQTAAGSTPKWAYPAVACGAALAALMAYEPALRGPFVFDDTSQPFMDEAFARAPFLQWIAGSRPVQMLTFWINVKLSGLDPFGYHFTNVLLHAGTALITFLIVLRVLGYAGEAGRRARALAGFAAALFLLHPLQTESVAYVTGRADVLSTLFAYAAIAVFLAAPAEGAGWLRGIAILLLFGIAVTTKEHAAVLPALLLLTDYFWRPGFSFRGIQRNWRVYVPMLAAGALASHFVLKVLRASDTAGLKLAEVSWTQYFFTQCRAIWLYLHLFVVPVGQNLDHDFPISRTILDHGAIFGLIGLVAASAAAIVWRKRYPLASYGFLTFLVLIAPTSSFIPILDPIAERRMYLPLIGLLFVVLEFLRRWKAQARVVAGVCTAVLVTMSGLTWARAGVWKDAATLWQDAAAKSPQKFRPHSNLGYAYYVLGACADAVNEYAAAERNSDGALFEHRYSMYVDWGLAYDCVGNRPKAIEKLQHAASMLRNAHVFAVMGSVYGKAGQTEEALKALDTAVQLDPNFQPTYTYRGAVYATRNDFVRAAAEYRHSLELNPTDEGARTGLAYVEARMRGGSR